MERKYFFVSQVLKTLFLLLVLYSYSSLFSAYYQPGLPSGLSLGNSSRQEM